MENIKLNKPRISIVIPVKNGIATLAKCLDGIKKQTAYQQCEVIIIDSGSTDGTLDLLKNFNVKVFEIPPEDFNHGATRNVGVQKAQGEFVVMTVQDAAAVDEHWLEKMLHHFEDAKVAGVCGQQIIPHEKGINPHLWFRPQSEPTVTTYQFKEKDEFLKLSPAERRKCCGWDDVNAMYRKSVLQELPFEPVMFGEDMLWAREALLKGYKLIYDNSSKVSHYHHHSPDYTYKRTLIVWLFIYKNFNFVRDMPYSLKDYIAVVYRNLKWKLHPKWILFNWSLIWNAQRAVKDFQKAVEKNEIEQLEAQFRLKIPQGVPKN